MVVNDSNDETVKLELSEGSQEVIQQALVHLYKNGQGKCTIQ